MHMCMYINHILIRKFTYICVCMDICTYVCVICRNDFLFIFSRCGRSFCYCLLVNNEIKIRKKLIRNAVAIRKAKEKERWC